MKRYLSAFLLIALFMGSCSSVNTMLNIKNEEEEEIKRINILERDKEERGKFHIHTPIYPLKKDDTTYSYTYQSKKEKTLIIIGEYEDGSRSNPHYYDASEEGQTNISFQKEEDLLVQTTDIANQIHIEGYRAFDKIIAGEPVKVRIVTEEQEKFTKGKTYRIKLKKGELFTPYVTWESDTSLLAEFTIPYQVGCTGPQNLIILDSGDCIYGYASLIVTASEKPHLWNHQDLMDKTLEDQKFQWINLGGKNLFAVYGLPVILDGDVEIDDYEIISDSQMKIRIRQPGRKPVETIKMLLPYLQGVNINQAKMRYQYVSIDLNTEHIIRQFVELRGDVAANITGEDSSSSTSGSGGMVWNYRWHNGRQIRLGAFYSVSNSDTLESERPQIYGSSFLNPFLIEGASIKAEALNFWDLFGQFNRSVIGMYAYGTFNKVIWKGMRPVVNDEGGLTDSTFLDVQDGHVFSFGIGINFTPFDQKIIAGNNIATLKFEFGAVFRDMEGDLGLKKNREFFASLLDISYRKDKGIRSFGLELGTKIRFNQIFVDIRYNWFPSYFSPLDDVSGFTGPRVVVRAGIEGNILKVDIN